MKIAIGSDHAGYLLKVTLLGWLIDQGHDVTDLGTYSEASVNYPHYGALVGRAVASGEYERGVAVCGSGQGICMAVNRVPGARGGVIRDVKDAEMTRRHNNANVACFGEAFSTPEYAIAALEVFLATGFDGGRHEMRVEQLSTLEESRGQAEV